MEYLFGLFGVALLFAFFLFTLLLECRSEVRKLLEQKATLQTDLWNKSEELANLRKSNPVSAVIQIDTTEIQKAIKEAMGELRAARKLAEAFPLPEVPPGVDTAAQVAQVAPAPLCRHCGKPESQHSEWSRPRACLPTLLPDGTLEERNTHFEPELGPYNASRQPYQPLPPVVEIFDCPKCKRPVAMCRCDMPTHG